ncbi:MAG: hypothetical protein WBF13_00205, partial [Candidatus Zixiibacteriota bacterium]
TSPLSPLSTKSKYTLTSVVKKIAFIGDRMSFACTEHPLREKKNHMNHIFDTEDEGQSSTQLKFLKTLIDKLVGQAWRSLLDEKVSSGATNSFRMNPFSKYLF